MRLVYLRNPNTNRLIQTYKLTLAGLWLSRYLFDNTFYGQNYPLVEPKTGTMLEEYINVHPDNPNYMDLTGHDDEE